MQNLLCVSMLIKNKNSFKINFRPKYGSMKSYQPKINRIIIMITTKFPNQRYSSTNL